MTNNYIQKSIRKICSLKLILPIVFIVFLLTVIYLFDFSALFSPVLVDNLWEVEDLYKDGTEIVDVSVEKLYYSGYDYIKGNDYYGSYYYATNGDECIIVLVDTTTSFYGSIPEEIENYKFRARLIKADRLYDQLLKHMALDLNWTDEGISAVTSKIILSESDYHPGYYTAMFIILGIMFAVTAIYMLIYIIYLINPMLYPCIRHLNRYGNALHIVKDANAELSTDLMESINHTFITKHYFVDFCHEQLLVLPIKDILWIYRFGAKHGKLPFQKTKPQFDMFITLIDGHRLNTARKNDIESNAILKYFQQSDDNIILGFTEEKHQIVQGVLNSEI